MSGEHDQGLEGDLLGGGGLYDESYGENDRQNTYDEAPQENNYEQQAQSGEQQQQQQPQSSENPDDNSVVGKMFVGGLSWDTTAEKLKAHFGQYGEITDCVVMKDPHTGRSRGFGFITFAEASVPDRVVAAGPHNIDGRSVDAKKAVPESEGRRARESAGRTKKIFVGGLPPETEESTLKQLFDQFGTVEDVALMRDRETTRLRGFGFITFDSEEAADRACQRQFYEYQSKQIEVKKADPLGTRRDGPGVRGGFRGGRGGYGGYGASYGGGYGDSGRGGRGGYGASGRGGRGGYGGGYGGQQGSYDAAGGYGGGYAAGYDQGGYGGYGQKSSGYDQSGYGAGGYGSTGYDQSSYGAWGGYGASGYGQGYGSGYGADYSGMGSYGAQSSSYGAQGANTSRPQRSYKPY